MKKILIFSLCLALVFGLSAKPAPKLNTVFDQVDYLLTLHQKAWLQNSAVNNFSKGFFTNTAFVRDRSAANFFRTVQHRIQNGQISPNRGYSMISYTSMISINGKTSAVSYSFAQKGSDIHFARQAYVNGQQLKAVYHYDTSGQLLNVKEFQNDQLVNQGMLEI